MDDIVCRAILHEVLAKSRLVNSIFNFNGEQVRGSQLLVEQISGLRDFGVYAFKCLFYIQVRNLYFQFRIRRFSYFQR